MLTQKESKKETSIPKMLTLNENKNETSTPKINMEAKREQKIGLYAKKRQTDVVGNFDTLLLIFIAVPKCTKNSTNRKLEC